jgi:hypothetical protein
VPTLTIELLQHQAQTAFNLPRGAVTFLTAFWLVAFTSTGLLGVESATTTHRQAPYTLVSDAHGKVLQTPDGRTIFRYLTENPPGSNLAANSACCLYPLNTPTGIRVVDLAPGDHRHHRGVFLAWHSMTFDQTRADFWGWGAHTPTEGRVIRNRSVDLVSADADEAILAIRNDWTIHNKLVLEETLQITVRERQAAYVLDMEFTLTPRVDVTLDESAFGGFCVKGRQDGEGAFYSSQGRVDLPAPHHMKPDSDWPPAPWYDYVIRLNEGPTVGVAVISHPENPPTRWHNIAGIAMNNPCIVALGPVSWPAAQSQRLRYRLVVHDGPPPVKLLNFMSQDW